MLFFGRRVQKWVQQFDPPDREVAQEIVNSLIFVETKVLLSEIRDLISDILPKTKKASLIPVRELIEGGALESYFPRDVNDLKVYTGMDGYSGNINDVRPVFLHPNKSPGSEAVLAQLCTQIHRENRKKILLGKKESSPSLSELRSTKCSDLILLDDIIASGQRVELFLRSLFRNRTLNSWVSGGKIKIHVVSYMRSVQSSYLDKEFKQKIIFHQAKNMDSFWDLDANIVDNYRSFFEKYSSNREKYPIGFGDAFSRVVFEHSVPNNCPALLWRKQGAYNALFPNRVVSASLAFEVQSKTDLGPPIREAFVAALSCLSMRKGVSTPRQLARTLGWGTAFTKDILKKLEDIEAIDASMKLTNRGEKELEYMTKIRKKVEFNKSYYYPVS